MPLSESDRKVERLSKLVEAGVELVAKMHDVLVEMQKIAGGQVATGDTLKALEGEFSHAWQKWYGSPYVWNFAKDRAQWKRLLKMATPDDIGRRVQGYFADADAFLRKAKHPFGLFVSRFNHYADPVRSEFHLDAPTGCIHTPPCTSDQEHTKRRTHDMRASV